MSPYDSTLGKKQDNCSVNHHDELHNIYSNHHSWLYGWLCKKLHCRYQAEDVAQDTFLRLFSFTHLSNIIEPRGFLTTTATRLIIDESRRKKVEQRYLDTYCYYHGSDEAIALSSEHLALVSEKLAIIIKMLEHLPENCQRAFVMSKFDGMSYANIANVLNVSTSMVQQYMTKIMVSYYKICVEYNDVHSWTLNNVPNSNTNKVTGNANNNIKYK